MTVVSDIFLFFEVTTVFYQLHLFVDVQILERNTLLIAFDRALPWRVFSRYFFIRRLHSQDRWLRPGHCQVALVRIRAGYATDRVHPLDGARGKPVSVRNNKLLETRLFTVGRPWTSASLSASLRFRLLQYDRLKRSVLLVGRLDEYVLKKTSSLLWEILDFSSLAVVPNKRGARCG